MSLIRKFWRAACKHQKRIAKPVPVSLPQIGPATASTSAPGLQTCPGGSGNAELGTFSSILDTIGQLLNPSSPLPNSSEATVDQTGSNGLHLSTSVGAKHATKSPSTPADCHGQAKALDMPAALRVTTPDQNVQIAPSLAQPVVTPALSSDVKELSGEFQPVGPATQSQGQPLGPASVTGGGTPTESGDFSETTALPSAATGSVPIAEVAVKSSVAETTEVAGLDPTEPANTVELAAANTNDLAAASATELVTATPIELGTTGTAGLAMATPTRPAAANTTESIAPTANKSTVATAIPLAAANTPSPLIPTVSKTALEQNPPVPPAGTPETIETHCPAGRPAPKPGPVSENLSVQAHRLSENPLNLSASAAAAKTEIVNMLGTTKGSQVSSAPVALDTTPVVPQSAQGQSFSTVVPVGQKTSSDTQDTATSPHTSDDGAGNSKGQSQKDSSPTFAATAVNAPAAETESTQGSSGSDGFGSAAGVMQSVLASAANKEANAAAPGKSPGQAAEQPSHTSTGTVEEHNSSSSTVYPTVVLSSAKLVERMGESELRLGIRAGEFGNVDIRTSMARNQFTAEISVERGELGRVLAAELPSLQNRLSEQRIPVANIVLQNPSAGNSGQSEQQKPREGQPMPSSSYETPREETAATPNPAAFVGAAEPGLRLDLHM